MEQKSEGVCRFCHRTFSGSSIGRHILACEVKKEKDSQYAVTAKRKYPIYYIKVSSSKYYWLHIEMKATSKLSDLDQFLRNIWLECCGHLSMFTIHEMHYDESPEQDDLSIFGGKKSESMNKRLNEVLAIKDKFEYQYDFGSTTYLEG